MTRIEKILLCRPRGFCAGVTRAVDIVSLALRTFGAPLYVRKEIVHNQHVLENFRRQGVTFVHDLGEVPIGATVVFSAHGVSPEVRRAAADRQLQVIDATCPLVTKVHREAVSFAKQGYSIVLIGHAGHDEVIGIAGEVNGRLHLVTGIPDAKAVNVEHPDKVVFLCQTTLSVMDTAEILAILRARFPRGVTPPKEDICYATQNRQIAVQEVAKSADMFLVLGSKNSSNSNRLREVAERSGMRAYLIENKDELDLQWLQGARRVGISAGASASEELVEALVNHLRTMTGAAVEECEVVEEAVSFLLPANLLAASGLRATAAVAAPHTRLGG
jgi:4-hydroxy-3-methylbut-2-enyl diphosphate reductase